MQTRNMAGPLHDAWVRYRVVIGLLVCAWLAGCNIGMAAAGQLHSFSANGLALTADVRWPEGAGYLPVRITVTPLISGMPDRTLRVEFMVSHNYRRSPNLTVAEFIEIPEGSGPVELTLSVPQVSGWNAYKIDVWEDGRLRKKLSTSWVGISNRGYGSEYVDNLPVVLMVGKDLPDTGELASLLPIEEYNQYRNMATSVSVDAAGNQSKPPLPSAFALPAVELPPRWIDYSGLDIVCMSLGELTQLKTTNPTAFDAILKWTAAGGNLWIYGAGSDWKGLAELEKLVGLSTNTPGNADPVARGWQKPNPSKFGKPLKGVYMDGEQPYASNQSGQYSYLVGVEEDALEDREMAEELLLDVQKKSQPDTAPFLLRKYELGMIVVMAADNPFPGQSIQWAWLLNSMGADRWLWYKRHGMSIRDTNPDYWSFLIPDVGLAPVGAFCVLITLFVLAIGPLNYWFLRRWKRLHLLVITIPFGAATVTLGLFGYAILADGLGTRVRVRSVTRLDQGRGTAACWSRLSYYSGMAPRGGLRFPADVAVMPLENVPMNHYNYNDRGKVRTMFWDSDQQLRQGWLASRTPTQYLTIRSCASDRGLDLTSSADGTLQITNRLGSPVRQLLVCSAEGNGYWAEGVEPDVTAALTPLDIPEAWARLRKTHLANRPAEPPGFEGDSYGPFGMGRRRRRFMVSSGYGDSDSPSQSTSRMEKELSRLGASSRTASMEPGSYVAVVEQSPEVVLGVSSAKEEASYHVIFGKW